MTAWVVVGDLAELLVPWAFAPEEGVYGQLLRYVNRTLATFTSCDTNYV